MLLGLNRSPKVQIRVVQTCEQCHILSEELRRLILQEVLLRVARLRLEWVLEKSNLIVSDFHFDSSHIDLADARVMLFEHVGFDRKERYSKFKTVFLSLERLWVVIVHIFEHGVDNEVRLFVVNQLEKLDRTVETNEQDE